MASFKRVCLTTNEQVVGIVGYLLSLAINSEQKAIAQDEKQKITRNHKLGDEKNRASLDNHLGRKQKITRNHKLGDEKDRASLDNHLGRKQKKINKDNKNTLVIQGPPDIPKLLERARKFAAINIHITVNPDMKTYNIRQKNDKKSAEEVIKFDTRAYFQYSCEPFNFSDICSLHHGVFYDLNVFLKEKFTQFDGRNLYIEDRMVSNYLLLPQDHQGTLDIDSLVRDHPKFPLRKCQNLKQGCSVHYETSENDITSIDKNHNTDTTKKRFTVHPGLYVTKRHVFQNILVLEDISLLTDQEIIRNNIKSLFIRAKENQNGYKWVDKIICMNEFTIRSLIYLQELARSFQKKFLDLKSNTPPQTETCTDCSLFQTNPSISSEKFKSISVTKHLVSANLPLCSSHFTFLLTSQVFVSCSLLKIEVRENDLTSNYRLSEKLNSLWNCYKVPNKNLNINEKYNVKESSSRNLIMFRDNDILDLRNTQISKRKEQIRRFNSHNKIDVESVDSKDYEKDTPSHTVNNSKISGRKDSSEYTVKEPHREIIRDGSKSLINDRDISLDHKFVGDVAKIHQAEPGSIEISNISGKRIKLVIYHDYHNQNIARNNSLPALKDHLMFLGTAAAIPTKYRNVSGILYYYGSKYEKRREEHLESSPKIIMSKNCTGTNIATTQDNVNFQKQTDESDPCSIFFNSSILLDCGEDTLSQIFRAYPNHQVNDIIRTISIIFISHSHADHHMGCLHIIKKWAELNSLDMKSFFNIDHKAKVSNTGSSVPDDLKSLNPYEKVDQENQKGLFDSLNRASFEDTGSNATMTSKISYNSKERPKDPHAQFENQDMHHNSVEPKKSTKIDKNYDAGSESRYDITLKSRHLIIICPLNVKQFLSFFNLPVKYILTDCIEEKTEITIANIRRSPANYHPFGEGKDLSNHELRKKHNHIINYRRDVASDTLYDSVKLSICRVNHIQNSRGIRIDTATPLSEYKDVHNQWNSQCSQTKKILKTHDETGGTSQYSLKMSFSPINYHAKSKSITYSGDTSPCDEFFSLSRDADLMIHDCTFIQDTERARYTKHTTMKQAIQGWLACGAKRLILTHFSQKIRSLLERKLNEEKLGTKFNSKSVAIGDEPEKQPKEWVHKYPKVQSHKNKENGSEVQKYDKKQNFLAGSNQIGNSDSDSLSAQISTDNEPDETDKIVYLGSQGKASSIKNVFIAYDYFKYDFDMEWKRIEELQMEEVDI